MMGERTAPLAGLLEPGGSPSFARVRLLEGSAELLLGQLRLHAKRVRALAAAFRRETRRLGTEVSADLGRIDHNLDRIATQSTVALSAIDLAFAGTFSGTGILDRRAANIDLEHPERSAAQRVAEHAETLLEGLRDRHAEARAALHFMIEQLVVCANNLAIVVGRPGEQSLEQLRIIIRQMRKLSQITAEISARLDVFVQNQSAALQELVPTSSARESVLASLRAQGAQIMVSAGEGEGRHGY
ncbi:MAG TPA: hypothetical protein VNL35_12415 [Chloroflexota bacterium]|nr:hypothetical protein [Chloroflexota bacterium]